MDSTDAELTTRAYAAYYRRCANNGSIPDQPANSSGVVEHDDKLYVVLENVRGTLAVYRIRTSGQLKELRRWPKEVASS